MHNDISNKTLATLLIVAIAVSVIGTFLTTTKPVYISGLATSGTGKVNVSISSLIAITVTGNIDFGSGYVYEGNSSARLESNGTTATNGSWTWTAQDIQIENTGNFACNVTFNASSAAATWLGAGATAFMAANVNAQDGCATENTTWQALQNGTVNMLCINLASTASADKVDAEAALEIPETLAGDSSQKQVTVTFYGHAGLTP